MNFSSLCTDVVSVLKTNGDRFDGISANVQSDSIFIPGTKPFIESGDLINRKMSNGGEETYEVIDPGFREKFHSIAASYHIQVKKLGIPETQKAIQHVTTYNINGNNARINKNSTDNSTNIVNTNPNALELLAALRSELKNLNISEDEKQSAGELLDVVNTQIQSEKPSRTVISTMLAALPQVAEITEIISELLPLLQ